MYKMSSMGLQLISSWVKTQNLIDEPEQNTQTNGNKLVALIQQRDQLTIEYDQNTQ